MTLDIYPNDSRNRPHTEVIVDSSNIGANSTDSQKGLVLFGSAKGGQPSEFYKVTSFAQAKAIFKSGELLDAIETAWRPSNSLQGAGVIYAMRVDSATQAILSTPELLFKAYQYGQDGNAISLKLEDGSIEESKKLTAYDSKTQKTEVYDNLGRIFDLKKSPTSTAAYLEVSLTNGVLTFKTGTEADKITAVNTFKLTDSRNVSSLISQINLIPDFQALPLPYGDKNVDLGKFEDIPVTAMTGSNTVFVKATNADIVHQLQYSNLVTAEFK